MSNSNLFETSVTMDISAVFSKDKSNRYVLKFKWDSTKKSAAIIMTFPSTADELLLDQTTMLVRNGAIKNDFGEIAILNVFSSVNGANPKVEKLNCSVIMSECEKADVVILAYGRSTSYTDEKDKVLEMLRCYKDKLYTISDSKGMLFSHPLSPYAHNWKLVKIS